MGILAAAAALLLLVAAGCGGSSKKSSATTTSSAATTAATTMTTTGGTVSAEAWSGSFCTAVYQWGTTIRKAGQALRANPTKANLQGAVATIKNANQTLVAALRSLGTPNIAGGAQVKTAIDSLATTLKTHADAIASAMASVSSPTELRAAAATLSSNLVAMGQAFTSTLTQLKSINKQSKGSFKQAFDKSSTCKKLKKASGG